MVSKKPPMQTRFAIGKKTVPPRSLRACSSLDSAGDAEVEAGLGLLDNGAPMLKDEIDERVVVLSEEGNNRNPTQRDY